ncbi:hypothetical protein [Nocardia sp. XZ_19_385]|uniref:hypothetical protein n=1 Tax=Nocardia sp. XZ_19_385 TaxID=2769488 RepID=UPI00188DEC13|nr:hypothetical protein [Nocardia sp. XZ_19_385]
MATGQPSEISTLASDLAELRKSVGEPSYERLHHALKKAAVADAVSITTLRNAVHAGRLPKLQTVVQFVKACRCVSERDDLMIDPETFDVHVWRERWMAAAELTR